MTDENDRLAQRLQEELDTWSWSVPPEFLRTVQMRSKRRRHASRVSIWTGAVLFVAAAVAVPLWAFGANNPGKTQRLSLDNGPRSVPWVSARNSAADGAAPTCTSSNVKVTYDSQFPSMGGQLIQMFKFSLTAGSTCIMPSIEPSGLSAATGTSEQAAPTSISTSPTPELDDSLNLSPSQTLTGDAPLFLPVATVADCTNPVAALSEAQHVNFNLTDGSTVSTDMPSDIPVRAECGASVGDFGSRNPVSTPAIDALQAASNDFPASVPAGSVTEFTVVLTNPTDTPVSLSPCPSYTEFVQPLGTAHSPATYELNCSTTSALPANSSLSFVMEVPVPSTTGAAKWGWDLDGTTVSTGGSTQVES